MKNKFLILSMLFSFTSFAQNVLINGDFSSGLNSWTSFSATWLGINPTFSAANNEANITNITGAGGATWHVQLNQEFTGAQINSLQVGSAYKVSFDARTNAGTRPLRMFFGENGGGFVPVNITDVTINDVMTNYEVTFTINQTFGAMKLGFEMGLSNSPVFIDNVVLEPFVGPVPPNQPVGFVASNTIGGSPVGAGEAFLSCGPNNVGGNVIYRLFYSPTASAPVDPTTATEYDFGAIAGDGGGFSAFGFVLPGLSPATNYTFWLYQYNLSSSLFSAPAIATTVTGDGVVPQMRNVTFRVDMSQYGGNYTTPEVNGTFNGWCGSCNAMTNIGNDVWEVTIQLLDGNYQYKFSHDAWLGEESLTPGSPCTVTGGPFTNRTLAVSGDVVLPTVCWNSCAACNVGPQVRNVTFRVDMSQYAGNYTTPEVNGNFNSWCGGCNPMTNIGNDIWETTIQLFDGTYEYKFAHDAWSGQENLTPGAPCTVTDGVFTNRFVVVSNDVVLPTVCWNSCSSCNGPTPPNNPAGLVAFDNIAGNPVAAGQAFVAAGPNNVGGTSNIIYRLFYAPTASAPSDPTTATEYSFGSTPGDGNAINSFGFVIGGLTPCTNYTFWLYQYNTVDMLFSVLPSTASVVTGCGTVGAPNQPVGFVAFDNVGGNPVNNDQVFLACGPNNVGGNIIYRLFYSPTASAPVDPTTATEYDFGSTAGDGGGFSAFGFVLSGLLPATNYTFWLYQYDLNQDLYSTPNIITFTTGGIPCVTENETDVISSCSPIVWLDGNTYTSSNNTATFLAVGAGLNGCDVLVTLNFTLWPCTQLGSNACNATNVGLDQALFAALVGAPAYRFRIVGPNNANWANNTVILDRTVRWFSFNPHVTGEIAGQTYTVEVAVGDGFGNFGPYGNACNVTLGALPTTQLTSNSCNAVNVLPSTALFANQVQEAQGYRFRIVGANNGDPSWDEDTIVVTRSVRWFRFDQHVPGFVQGSTYQVRVAYLTNDGVTYSPYGPVCSVALFAPLEKPSAANNDIFVDNKTMKVVEFGANASHNPFTTDFGIQVLNANDMEAINVSVYDMSGKLIERSAVNPMDIESARFGANLASGMYMIEVRQGSNQAVIRQVKN